MKYNTEASSLNKSSCLAPTLGVTKFIIVKGIRSHFIVILKSDLDDSYKVDHT